MVMSNKQELAAFTENVPCYHTEHSGLGVRFWSPPFLHSSLLLPGWVSLLRESLSKVYELLSILQEKKKKQAYNDKMCLSEQCNS